MSLPQQKGGSWDELCWNADHAGPWAAGRCLGQELGLALLVL